MKELTKKSKNNNTLFWCIAKLFFLWLESVRQNPNVNVLFLTNNSLPKNCPQNIEWIVTTFNDVKKGHKN